MSRSHEARHAFRRGHSTTLAAQQDEARRRAVEAYRGVPPPTPPPTPADLEATRDVGGDAGGAGGAGGSIARSGALMASGTLVSRVLGLVRQTMTLAVVGGTGYVADAWTASNTLPNIFHLLLAGGVLNAVIVPQITRAMRRPDGELYVNRLLTVAMTAMGVATVLLTALAPVLVSLVVSADWDDDARGLAVAFAFISLPQMFFYGLYTLLGQVLNARSRFGAFMWAPAAANVVAIAGLAWFMLTGRGLSTDVDAWTATMIWVLAGSATLSIVVQALVLIPSLRAIGFRYRPAWGLRGSGLGDASRMALWAFSAVTIGQLAYFVTSRVLTGATQVGEQDGATAAGITAYSYAFLIFMLPHSLVTVSLVTAIFTRLSNAAADDDTAAVTADLRRGLRMPAVVLVPATAAMVVLAPWILRVVLPGNPESTIDAIIGVFVAMAIGLVPYSWFYLVQRACYAYEDGKTPFVLQLVVSGLAVAFTLFASTRHYSDTATWVGIGQTVSNLAGAVIGFVVLRRRIGPLGLSDVVRQHVRLVVATIAATVVAALVALVLGGVLGTGWLSSVIVLTISGGLLLLVCFVLAARMQVREVAQLFAPVARRLERR